MVKSANVILQNAFQFNLHAKRKIELYKIPEAKKENFKHFSDFFCDIRYFNTFYKDKNVLDISLNYL